MVPRPPVDLAHAPQVPDPGHVPLDHAGDQELPRLHRGSRQDQLLPVPGLDGGDQGVLGGHGVARLLLADDFRRGNPLPHLDVGPAAPDVDGDIAQLRKIQQDVVAQLRGIHVQPVGPEAHAVLFQGPEDLLPGDVHVALHLEIPDKEGPPEQQGHAGPQGDPQSVPAADPAQEEGGALPVHGGHVAVDAPAQPPQPFPVPPGHGESELHRRGPAEVPKYDAVLGADVEHPFRETALHPAGHLALSQVYQTLQHITSPIPPLRWFP